MIEDALVEEHQGIHGLVLCGRCDVSVHRQVGQERFNPGFGGEEIIARLHPVETDETHDPVHIGTLGVNGVMMESKHIADFIKELGLLTAGGVSNIRSP